MILASTVEQSSDGLSLQADRSDGVWILWMLDILISGFCQLEAGKIWMWWGLWDEKED
jgi:hypothetical protein